ncbi:MAG: hypothetical protein ABJH52_10890 [Henriciella sp.]
MSALAQWEYYSVWTIIGAIWSILTYWLMFSERGKALLSNPLFIIPAAAAMVPSIWFVSSEILRLAELANGISPLDAQYGYGVDQINELALALGNSGRAEYAAFQLGVDTLAPPAFACFLMAVYRSTVQSKQVQRALTVLAFTYFTSVLIANAFTPVIFHNYPDAETGLLPLLYAVIPKFDLAKYSTHGIAWLVIFGTWIWQIGNWGVARFAAKK